MTPGAQPVFVLNTPTAKAPAPQEEAMADSATAAAPAAAAGPTPTAARTPVESPSTLDRKLRAHSTKDSPMLSSATQQVSSEQKEKLKAAELWKQLLSEKAARKASATRRQPSAAAGLRCANSDDYFAGTRHTEQARFCASLPYNVRRLQRAAQRRRSTPSATSASGGTRRRPSTPRCRRVSSLGPLRHPVTSTPELFNSAGHAPPESRQQHDLKPTSQKSKLTAHAIRD